MSRPMIRRTLLASLALSLTAAAETPESVKESYGLGWNTSGGTPGHGGAYATNMTIDPQSGLITVFMVQHAGFPGNGKDSGGAFRKAAIEAFGKK